MRFRSLTEKELCCVSAAKLRSSYW